MQSLFACLLILCTLTAESGELQAGISLVPLLMSTPALHVNYRLSQSHFQVGYKYEQWAVNLIDNTTHVKTTAITHARHGPIVIFLSDVEADSSMYFGIELLKWTAHEKPLAPSGGSENSSSMDLYFGGGNTGHLAKSLYYNFGFFLSPTADLTSPSMKRTGGDSSGGSFDLHLQFGLYF